MQNLNIAYIKSTNVVCADHFNKHHIGNKGRLLPVAEPTCISTGNALHIKNIDIFNISEIHMKRV